VDDTVTQSAPAPQLPPMTLPDLRRAKLRCTAILDGQGFCRRTYVCDTIPELTKVVTVIRGKAAKGMRYGSHLFVAGQPVVNVAEAVLEAINRHRGHG
jgi:hypothetical protein